MTIDELREKLEDLDNKLSEQRDRAERIHDELTERVDEVQGWIFELDDYEDAQEAVDDTVTTLKAIIEQLT